MPPLRTRSDVYVCVRCCPARTKSGRTSEHRGRRNPSPFALSGTKGTARSSEPASGRKREEPGMVKRGSRPWRSPPGGRNTRAPRTTDEPVTARCPHPGRRSRSGSTSASRTTQTSRELPRREGSQWDAEAKPGPCFAHRSAQGRASRPDARRRRPRWANVRPSKRSAIR